MRLLLLGALLTSWFALNAQTSLVKLCENDSARISLSQEGTTYWYFKDLQDSTFDIITVAPSLTIKGMEGNVFGVLETESCEVIVSDTVMIVGVGELSALTGNQNLLSIDTSRLYINASYEVTNHFKDSLEANPKYPDQIQWLVTDDGLILEVNNLEQSINTLHLNPEWVHLHPTDSFFPSADGNETFPYHEYHFEYRDRIIFNDCDTVNQINKDVLLNEQNFFFSQRTEGDPLFMGFLSGSVQVLAARDSAKNVLGIMNKQGSALPPLELSLTLKEVGNPSNHFEFKDSIPALGIGECFIFGEDNDYFPVWPDGLPSGEYEATVNISAIDTTTFQRTPIGYGHKVYTYTNENAGNYTLSAEPILDLNAFCGDHGIRIQLENSSPLHRKNLVFYHQRVNSDSTKTNPAAIASLDKMSAMDDQEFNISLYLSEDHTNHFFFIDEDRQDTLATCSLSVPDLSHNDSDIQSIHLKVNQVRIDETINSRKTSLGDYVKHYYTYKTIGESPDDWIMISNDYDPTKYQFMVHDSVYLGLADTLALSLETLFGPSLGENMTYMLRLRSLDNSDTLVIAEDTFDVSEAQVNTSVSGTAYNFPNNHEFEKFQQFGAVLNQWSGTGSAFLDIIPNTQRCLGSQINQLTVYLEVDETQEFLPDLAGVPTVEEIIHENDSISLHYQLIVENKGNGLAPASQVALMRNDTIMVREIDLAHSYQYHLYNRHYDQDRSIYMAEVKQLIEITALDPGERDTVNLYLPLTDTTNWFVFQLGYQNTFLEYDEGHNTHLARSISCPEGTVFLEPNIIIDFHGKTSNGLDDFTVDLNTGSNHIGKVNPGDSLDMDFRIYNNGLTRSEAAKAYVRIVPLPPIENAYYQLKDEEISQAITVDTLEISEIDPVQPGISPFAKLNTRFEPAKYIEPGNGIGLFLEIDPEGVNRICDPAWSNINYFDDIQRVFIQGAEVTVSSISDIPSGLSCGEEFTIDITIQNSSLDFSTNETFYLKLEDTYGLSDSVAIHGIQAPATLGEYVEKVISLPVHVSPDIDSQGAIDYQLNITLDMSNTAAEKKIQEYQIRETLEVDFEAGTLGMVTIDTATNHKISWTEVEGATGYKYRLKNKSTGEILRQEATDANQIIPNLKYTGNITVEVAIVAYNARCGLSNPVVNDYIFTQPPLTSEDIPDVPPGDEQVPDGAGPNELIPPNLLKPADGATNQCVEVPTLVVEPHHEDFRIEYIFYMGTSPDNMIRVNKFPEKDASLSISSLRTEAFISQLLPIQENTTYYWTVAATDDGTLEYNAATDSWDWIDGPIVQNDEVFSFTTGAVASTTNQPLPTPQITFPENGATDVRICDWPQWEASNSCDPYQVRHFYGTDPNNLPELNTTGLNKAVDANEYETTYYYRVELYNDTEMTSSETISFTTDSGSVNKPTILYPYDSSIVDINTSLVLDHNGNLDSERCSPVHYSVLLWSGRDWYPVWQTEYKDSYDLRIPTLEYDKEYDLTVKAYDENGNSVTSDVVTFRTKKAPSTPPNGGSGGGESGDGSDSSDTGSIPPNSGYCWWEGVVLDQKYDESSQKQWIRFTNPNNFRVHYKYYFPKIDGTYDVGTWDLDPGQTTTAHAYGAENCYLLLFTKYDERVACPFPDEEDVDWSACD